MFIWHYKSEDLSKKADLHSRPVWYSMKKRPVTLRSISQIISCHFCLFLIHSSSSVSVEVKHENRGKTYQCREIFSFYKADCLCGHVGVFVLKEIRAIVTFTNWALNCCVMPSCRCLCKWLMITWLSLTGFLFIWLNKSVKVSVLYINLYINYIYWIYPNAKWTIFKDQTSVTFFMIMILFTMKSPGELWKAKAHYSTQVIK